MLRKSEIIYKGAWNVYTKKEDPRTIRSREMFKNAVISLLSEDSTISNLTVQKVAAKEAGVTGAMSSFSYIDGKWANPELLNGMLRDEWGFEGVVSSDAVFGFMEPQIAITSGNDLMLDVLSVTKNKKLLEEAYNEHPEAITAGLRNSMHNSLYATLKTYLFN